MNGRFDIDKLKLAPGRGRKAKNPFNIPVDGWLDVILRCWRGFFQDNIMLVAAGVAYYTLLAIFPAIVLFVSLYGLFSDAAKAAEDARALAGILPPLAAEFVYKEMSRVAEAGSGGLSFISIITLLLTLFGAGRAVKSMFQALNVAYGEKETRNLLVINLLGTAFTLLGLLTGAVILALVVGVPALTSAISLGLRAETVISIVRWPVLFVVMVFGTSLLYRYGPDRSPARFKWLNHGAFISAVLWLLTSWGISFWASNIFDYSGVYGTFGAVILLQTWLWLTALTVLVGAKINAEAEHQTAVDTTTGKPQPLGERGALVADELGRTREQGGDPVHEDLSEA